VLGLPIVGSKAGCGLKALQGFTKAATVGQNKPKAMV
jgi:hypothetical protein